MSAAKHQGAYRGPDRRRSIERRAMATRRSGGLTTRGAAVALELLEGGAYG